MRTEKTIDFYCRMIERYLDQHPEKEIRSYVHMIDGEWKHAVQIQDKKIGEYRK